MSLELLLVRHGKAEDRSAEIDDTERQLTDTGKEEFTDFISSVKKHLETDLDIQVWTSPLERAKQTAAILTEQMGWPEATEKEFLASGNLRTFLNEVKNVAADTRVVCVGHKPIQGDWVGVLTSRPYAFKKGGVALIRLDEDRAHGQLVWDNDPKRKQEMEEKAKPIKAVLLKQVEKMEEAYTDFQNNPYSPELTHQLRVDVRKLLSLLNFIKPLFEKEDYKELKERVKDGYHRLEPLREGDVLIDTSSEQALSAPDLIDDYPNVFRHLHNDRRKWMRSRQTKSMTAAFQYMIAETRENIAQLDFNMEKTVDGDIESYLTKRFKSRKKKVYKAFKKTDHSDDKAAHEVRKKARKLRHAIKGFKEFLPKKKVKKAKKKLRRIQDDLGELRDLSRNSERLTNYADKVDDKSLQEDFQTLADHQLSLRDEKVTEDLDSNETV